MSSLNGFKKYEWLERFPILSIIFRQKIKKIRETIKTEYGMDNCRFLRGESLVEVIEIAEEREKTLKLLKNLLKDLLPLRFPLEICKLVRSGDLFYDSILSTRLLQELVEGEISEISYKDIPPDDHIIPTTLLVAVPPLQALKQRIIIIAYDITKYNEEIERQLNIIQTMVRQDGWTGFFNDKGWSGNGATLGDIWAENKDGWIVVSQDIDHWSMPSWFDWSVFKEAEKKLHVIPL